MYIAPSPSPAGMRSSQPEPGRRSSRLRHAELPDLNARVVLHPNIMEEEIASRDLLRQMGFLESSDDQWYHPRSVFSCTASKAHKFCLWSREDTRRCSITFEINGHSANGLPAKILEPMGSLHLPSCLRGPHCHWDGHNLKRHILVLEDRELVARQLRYREQDALKKRAKDKWFGYRQDTSPRLIPAKGTAKAPHPPTPVATPDTSPISTAGSSKRTGAAYIPTSRNDTEGLLPVSGTVRAIRLRVNTAKSPRQTGVGSNANPRDDIDDIHDSGNDEATTDDTRKQDIILDGEELGDCLIVSKALFRDTQDSAARSRSWKRKAKYLLETNKKLKAQTETAEEKLQAAMVANKDIEDERRNASERQELLLAAEDKIRTMELQARDVEVKIQLLQGNTSKLREAEASQAALKAQLSSMQRQLQVAESTVKAAEESEKAARKETRVALLKACEAEQDGKAKMQRIDEFFRDLLAGQPNDADL